MMILFPQAKINLGLRVLETRSDGYHNIDSLFYPAPLWDILELLPSGSKTEPVSLYRYGLPSPWSTDKDLCVKAFHLLAADYSLPPTQIHLCRNIPDKAGLGGGSADAAYCLMGLNRLYHLGLDTATLREYGCKIGMDVAFFIQDSVVQGGKVEAYLASGRGDILSRLQPNLENYDIVLLKPGEFGVSTAQAYSALDNDRGREEGELSVGEIVRMEVGLWKRLLHNHFEMLLQNNKDFLQMKEKLYEGGAVYVSLSGSGSAVYAIYQKGKGSISQSLRAYILNRPLPVQVLRTEADRLQLP